MAILNGLRPTSEKKSTASRQKKGRVLVEKAEKAQVALVPKAAPTNNYVAPTALTKQTGAGNLVKALSGLSPALQEYGAVKQKQADDDIMLAAEYHMDRIRGELGSGVIQATQVGEALPEASHTVVARITQSMGKKQGKEFFQNALDEIDGDDSIRLNTASRKAYIDNLRAESKKSAGKDPFYQSGFTEGLEAQINQHESKWAAETAQYHQNIQSEEFSEQVVNAYTAGEDLTQVDKSWSSSSSLNPLERKKLAVEALINHAITERDPSVLNKVPTLFLNADYKKDIARAKDQIKNTRDSEWAYYQQRLTVQRREETRNNKIGMLGELNESGSIDLMKHRNDPEAVSFGMSVLNAPHVDTTTSKVNTQRLKSSILKAAMSGDAENALSEYKFQGDLNEDNLYNLILNDRSLNAKDKQELVGTIPSLIEGVAVMKDPRVASTLSNVITPALNDLARSTNADLQKLMTGTNLRARVMVGYEDAIQLSFMEHYEETGEWAKGLAKQKIINEARDEALKTIENATRIGAATPTDAPSSDQAVKRVRTFTNGGLTDGGNAGD